MDSRLTQVLNTLNQIEVQGKDNLNKLLGCILVLEDVIGKPNVDAPVANPEETREIPVE